MHKSAGRRRCVPLPSSVLPGHPRYTTSRRTTGTSWLHVRRSTLVDLSGESGATGSVSGPCPPSALLAALGRRWIGPARPAGRILESPVRPVFRLRKPLCANVSESITRLSPCIPVSADRRVNAYRPGSSSVCPSPLIRERAAPAPGSDKILRIRPGAPPVSAAVGSPDLGVGGPPVRDATQRHRQNPTTAEHSKKAENEATSLAEPLTQPRDRTRRPAYPSRGGYTDSRIDPVGERPHPYANSSAPSTGAGTRRVPGDPSAAARSDPSCSASNPPSDHTSNVAPTVCSATECARS
ncbi:hypothetical protein RR21198_5999 [Rhodococcus rhodochrous ATCC 21198]|nr:hypothetical protein RR21198_5999 [Rhodococcus rhodochrous ATCC 21198]